jgi:hypothetical protein
MCKKERKKESKNERKKERKEGSGREYESVRVLRRGIYLFSHSLTLSDHV